MTRHWNVLEKAKPEEIQDLQHKIGVEEPIAQILWQRGIRSMEDGRSFFKSGLQDLHDPFLMKGMDKAVERLQQALEEGQKVLVPVYYAAQLLDSDLSNGALLLGGQVDLNANNLANTGTISADDSLSMNTAQNLLNQGTITAANNLSLVSSGSLGNFVELPDGDHYLSGYENRITFAKTMIEFLQSHLNPQTTLSVR